MKIVILKTWLTNIGNGFIDKGAKQIIKQAFPDAEIIEVSGYPNLVNKQLSKGELAGLGQVVQEIGNSDVISRIRESFRHGDLDTDDDFGGATPVNIAELIDADLAVLPGCILSDHGLGTYYSTLKHLQNNDVPTVLLGVGGGNYQSSTVDYVTKIINDLDIQAIITRDEVAYSKYNTVVENAHSGIDCAFFIDDWYQPPESNTQFITSTFDSSDEPPIEADVEIIRPCHAPFTENIPYPGISYKFTNHFGKKKKISKNNSFVSDELKDYLFLYANTEVTFSDRIHACVPTLVYGNKAKFSYDTPRSNLFTHVLDSEINKQPVQINENKLDKLKNTQVEIFKELVNKLNIK